MDTKITYADYGSISQSDYSKFNIVPFGCKCEDRAGYIYIINIIGTNLCTFGHAVHALDKIKSDVKIYSNALPLQGSSLSFQAYMSKPVVKRKFLLAELDKQFSKCQVNDIWYDCGYENAIHVLQSLEPSCICTPALEHVSALLSEDGYSLYCLQQKYSKFVYRKSIQLFKFNYFMLTNYPHLYNNDSIYHFPFETCAYDIKCALDDYLDYLITSKDSLRADTNLPASKSYSSYTQAVKYTKEFITDLNNYIHNAKD